MEILKVPQGEFRLSRYPARKKEQLRAWDAADEYLLNYFNEEFSSVVKNDKVLIVNDSFGALAAALSEFESTIWTDSLLAKKGILQNFANNELPSENINIKNSIESPEGNYDFVLIKFQKA